MVAMAAVPGGTSATSDDWPTCNNAQIFTEGEFEGELQTSSETDAMGFRLSPGEYLKITMEFPERAGSPDVYLQNGPANMNLLHDETDARGAINVGFGLGDSNAHLKPKPGETAEIEVWGVEPLPNDWLCLRIEDSDWETSYEWGLTVERSNPDVELYDVRQLEDRVAELRGEMEQKEQRIDELESDLADKEERIEELEAELEDADVTIDVSVEPADQATFQVGGEMRVEVDTEGAASSDVKLDFAGQQYTPSDDEAVIPLESSGTQDLAIEYGDTTETVTLDVAQDDADTAEETPGERQTDGADADEDSPPDTDATGEDMPGFSVGVAILALLTAGYLLRES